MLNFSHLLIKNIIINHIFRTLENEPIDCRLHSLTSQIANVEIRVYKVRGPTSLGHMHPKKGHVWPM